MSYRSGRSDTRRNHLLGLGRTVRRVGVLIHDTARQTTALSGVDSAERDGAADEAVERGKLLAADRHMVFNTEAFAEKL